MSATDLDAAVVATLTTAQRRGWIGSAPLDQHIRHARSFLPALDERAPPRASLVDLGPGGGLPALVLLADRPAWAGTLVERSQTRADALIRCVARAGWEERVRVVVDDAALVGRDERERGQHDLVVARSFAAPAVTAECAAPLLRVGGRLVVADPPAGPGDRWPTAGLAEFGLEAVRAPIEMDRDDPFRANPVPPTPAGPRVALAVLDQVGPCPDRFPRRPPSIRRAPRFT